MFQFFRKQIYIVHHEHKTSFVELKISLSQTLFPTYNYLLLSEENLMGI